MGATYDYNTRQITRDFHFVKEGEICKLAYSTPARVGGWSCEHCKFYKGLDLDYDNRIETSFFVKCGHPDSKDSKDAGNVIYRFNERLEEEAWSHYDY